jgi:hypothetical protein
VSETSPSGLLDETGRKVSADETVEPLVQYVQKLCTALAALAVGFVLSKIF